jgi:hypothetical protein
VSLAAVLNDIWTSELPRCDRRYLCLQVVASRQGRGEHQGAHVRDPGAVLQLFERTLLAAKSAVGQPVGLGKIRHMLIAAGRRDLVQRVTELNRARRATAHPDVGLADEVGEALRVVILYEGRDVCSKVAWDGCDDDGEDYWRDSIRRDSSSSSGAEAPGVVSVATNGACKVDPRSGSPCGTASSSCPPVRSEVGFGGGSSVGTHGAPSRLEQCAVGSYDHDTAVRFAGRRFNLGLPVVGERFYIGGESPDSSPELGSDSQSPSLGSKVLFTEKALTTAEPQYAKMQPQQVIEHHQVGDMYESMCEGCNAEGVVDSVVGTSGGDEAEKVAVEGHFHGAEEAWSLKAEVEKQLAARAGAAAESTMMHIKEDKAAGESPWTTVSRGRASARRRARAGTGAAARSSPNVAVCRISHGAVVLLAACHLFWLLGHLVCKGSDGSFAIEIEGDVLEPETWVDFDDEVGFGPEECREDSDEPCIIVNFRGEEIFVCEGEICDEFGECVEGAEVCGACESLQPFAGEPAGDWQDCVLRLCFVGSGVVAADSQDLCAPPVVSGGSAIC